MTNFGMLVLRMGGGELGLECTRCGHRVVRSAEALARLANPRADVFPEQVFRALKCTRCGKRGAKVCRIADTGHRETWLKSAQLKPVPGGSEGP